MGLLRRQRAPHMNARVSRKVPVQGHWVAVLTGVTSLYFRPLETIVEERPHTHTLLVCVVDRLRTKGLWEHRVDSYPARRSDSCPRFKQTLVHF